MQDPDTVRSFYCMECGGEGDMNMKWVMDMKLNTVHFVVQI